jgi:PAS domain-containing protein
LVLVTMLPRGARADDAVPRSFNRYLDALTSLDRHETAALVLVLGILLFAVVTAIMLVRARRRAAATEATLRDQLVALKAEADRFNALLLSEPQILVSWAAADDAPEIRGDVALVTSAALPQRVLAFGSWLEPHHAQAMEHAVGALRAHGEGFAMPLTTLAGRAIEAEGRAIGGQAVLRLRDISGLKRELAELAARHERLSNEGESLRALIEAMPAPVWVRDSADTLACVNLAYVRAVESRNATEALGRGLELLGRATRAEASQTRGAGKPFAARVPAIVAGGRCTLDVLDIPTRNGSAGLGIDVTEIEALRSEIGRLGDAHRQTLDQVATGVAILAATKG